MSREGAVDPLEAARTLLHRASEAALNGRMWRAKESAQLAASLARTAARLGLAGAKDSAEPPEPNTEAWRDAPSDPETDEKERRELKRIFLINDMQQIVRGRTKGRWADYTPEEAVVRQKLREMGDISWAEATAAKIWRYNPPRAR